MDSTSGSESISDTAGFRIAPRHCVFVNSHRTLLASEPTDRPCANLATGYLVGRKLTVLQALGVSVLFIWSATMTALSVHGNLNRALWFVEQLAQLRPDEPFVLNRIFLHSFSVMATLSISVSLFFMYQIRKTPQAGNATA